MWGSTLDVRIWRQINVTLPWLLSCLHVRQTRATNAYMSLKIQQCWISAIAACICRKEVSLQLPHPPDDCASYFFLGQRLSSDLPHKIAFCQCLVMIEVTIASDVIFNPKILCEYFGSASQCDSLLCAIVTLNITLNIAFRGFLHNYGEIATKRSLKSGLCPTVIEWLQGFLIMHNTVDSTAHSIPLNILEQCMLPPSMTTIRLGRDSVPVQTRVFVST